VFGEEGVKIVRVQDEGDEETHDPQEEEDCDERAVDARVNRQVIRVHTALDEGDEAQESAGDQQVASVVSQSQEGRFQALSAGVIVHHAAASPAVVPALHVFFRGEFKKFVQAKFVDVISQAMFVSRNRYHR